MYQAVFNDKLHGQVFVWDDETGMTTYGSDRFRYAYSKKKGGAYKSIFGDELEKIEHYDDADPTLFESDLNVEMKVLLDLYSNNEEISKGHRIIIYDIETSTEGGFPDITLGDKPITAIALYDVSGNKYHSLILDREKKIKNSETGNVAIASFDCEEKLLNYFLALWRKINPTIISGWNCIPTTSNIWTSSEIKPILELTAGEKLHDGDLIRFFPITKKKIWNIKLNNSARCVSPDSIRSHSFLLIKKGNMSSSHGRFNPVGSP